MLACHALQRGYRATIYTYNLQIFDPSWFEGPAIDISQRLRQQAAYKTSPKLRTATQAYLQFFEFGGQLGFEDLTPVLIRRYLNRGIPILTGLSATYLYRSKREFGSHMELDDVRGEPSGHFVVLCGYDRAERTVTIADPFQPNPMAQSSLYEVGIERVLCSILLGIVTYDANLLLIEPRDGHRHGGGPRP